MQRFITLALDTRNARHGVVEDHLKEHLSEGWRVASVCSLGGQAELIWVAIVLEKGEPAAQGQFLPGAQVGGMPFNPFMPMVEFPQSEEGKPVEPTEVYVNADTPLEVGSRVLAYSQGRWWRADVVALESDDRVKIHFPGWDSKWDVVVSREELQVDLNISEE